jgi:hypothetical protein
MEASMAGAGLILAIYALIVPMAQRIFKESVEDLNSKITEFEKLKNKITPESDDNELKQLKNLIREIKDLRKFPSYLGIGVVFTFFLFAISIYFDTLWIITPSPHSTGFDFLVVLLFITATSIFLVVGVGAISRIYKSIKKEFDEITKKQKELKLDDFGKGTDSVATTAELGLNDSGKGTDSITIKKIDNKKES